MLFHTYGGANIGVKNCMSQFYMFVPTKSNVKLANENMGHEQVIGIVLCFPLTVPLYIQWEQFIVVQVTLPTPYHQGKSNIMLAFKMLHMNLLNMQVQLSVGVLHYWLGSDYIQPVIQNTINSWDYMILLWNKGAKEIILCDIVLLWRVYYVISCSAYLCFTE